MERYSVHGACLVDNETGRVRVEAMDTPRNLRLLSKLADKMNRKERERAAVDRLIRGNTCAWI